MASRTSTTLLLLALLSVPVQAGEWTSWRGPSQNGVSDETGLISSWSLGGQHLLWKADFVGRSTPVAFDSRICATGRTGEGVNKQEMVACFDAESGKMLWEHRFNVFHTTVPFSRVGWTNPVGDPETGNLYVHGVGGLLLGYDKKGKVLWSRSLTEEFGRFSGYGGRTHSPIIDEGRVVLGFSNAGWGSHAAPRHRYFAFDKKTGELIWISDPAGRPRTMTTYSTPVVAVINGQRLLVGGNSDGSIYALRSRTGEMVWRFELSKLGINTSVVVDGARVFATTGDEPIDEAIMGRVVGIDATGTGDVTKTHEVWRRSGIKVKYASPLVHDGVLFVVDDSANLHALDAATGESRWEINLGTVGKGSPVWADGKLYVTEVNGNFHILRPEKDQAIRLDQEFLTVDGERYAEIYGSPAIAYGHVYFATEEGLYCLGDPDSPMDDHKKNGPTLPDEQPLAEDAKRTWVQIVPPEVATAPGTTVRLEAQAFAAGQPLDAAQGTWSLDGLLGTVGPKGSFTPDPKAGGQAGLVRFEVNGLEATARVRVIPDLPWTEDFSSIDVRKNPSWWVGAGRFLVEELNGNKVLAKPFKGAGLERQNVYLGPSDMTGFTVQADLLGTKKGRRRPDMGLIAGRYTLDLQGNHQRLQIRDWAELRFEETIDFPWDPDVWYTMKVRVDMKESAAVIRGKVWKAAEAEPEAWTLTAEDPVPNTEGSPGLYGYSPTTIYYDNVKVTVSE
jgi:outer membrane protein assembly factor BamB